MKKRLFALILCLALALSMVGCAETAADDLAVTGNRPQLQAPSGPVAADFAVRLFQNCVSDKNTVVSPLSVLYALSMTANGADGETRAQMEQVLGSPVAELNDYLGGYLNTLPNEETCRFHLANSIWFRDDDGLTVEQDFLQTTADYYAAGVFRAPFTDKTCQDINNWVKEHTDGQIPAILNEIPDEALLYLINALSFDAEWEDIYEDTQIRDGEFTCEDGTVRQVELMRSTEWAYLEDEMATGVMKDYAGGDFAFVGLLPKGGVSVQDYVNFLTGEHLSDLLANPQEEKVYAGIPKFETEFDMELSEALQAMGMTDAFRSDADFSKMGSYESYNLCISSVLHKARIAVDERGTEAGAATVVMVESGCAMPVEPPKEVYLTRPFVYLIVDCQRQLPIFMGTVMDIGK